MTKKIKLLDLCCKAGGCSVGYYRAAKKLGLEIEITGVDIENQPNYPFKFIQANAVEFLKENYTQYTHIHASPPCQRFSTSTASARRKGKVYNDILNDIREEIKKTLLPGVIENVPTAPIRADYRLRGDMFNLKVLRLRHFECVNWVPSYIPDLPATYEGSVKNGDYASVFGKGQKKGSGKDCLEFKYPGSVLDKWSYAMQIDWMTVNELAEAIPPVYTEFIGYDFLTL